MVDRIVRVCPEYRYGVRSVLRFGERFRVSGGPVYLTEDGAVLPMYERGTFVFRRYCVCGAARWIEAARADGSGIAILWVGRSCRSTSIPGLRRRPYRIIKCRG